ncbi:MAG: ABC transporter substrate-binding protein [Pseudomonadota bacterium]
MACEVHLRGLAWDHRRCWGPLDASVSTYCAARPGLTIEWDRRSLWEFGEGRLESPTANYDLIIYDHPFVGEVARDGLMVDLSTLLSQTQRKAFEADSLGPCWQSYCFDGGVWALPIDAAAQTASCRPDLLSRYASKPPRAFDEVLALGKSVAADDRYIAWPSIPTDVMCTVLTIAAGSGYLPSRKAPFLAQDELSHAMDALRQLRNLAHPLSTKWNPIACYDHMSAHDDVVYVPYAFSYVNYASSENQAPIAFTDIPAIGRGGASGALLGGAGIGVSACSKHVNAAFDYAVFLSGQDYQSGDYVRYGGQPGSLGAWTSEEADATANGFFSATRQTMLNSYLRPNVPGFITFFRQAAELTSSHLAEGDASGDAQLADQLNRIIESALSDTEHAA